MSGGEGNDSVIGGQGNDELIGGAGNDALVGGKGNDVYVFNRGDGQDTISATNTFFEWDLGADKIEFGSGGIQREEVLLTKMGEYLIVGSKGTDDRIALEKFYSFDSSYFGYSLKELEFADGTSMDLGKDLALSGTDAADSIVGTFGSDTINGLDGNDTLVGGQGDDVFFGGEGNDSLVGGQGNDGLSGGVGNDILAGMKAMTY